MHESARKWNAIYVIYLLEISGANKLSLFDVLLQDPYIFHSKQRESFYFPRLPQFKLAFWDCYVRNLGLAHAKFQLTYATIP